MSFVVYLSSTGILKIEEGKHEMPASGLKDYVNTYLGGGTLPMSIQVSKLTLLKVFFS